MTPNTEPKPATDAEIAEFQKLFEEMGQYVSLGYKPAMSVFARIEQEREMRRELDEKLTCEKAHHEITKMAFSAALRQSREWRAKMLAAEKLQSAEPWADESWRSSFDTTEQIVYCLYKCLECGACLEACDRGKHYKWHRAAKMESDYAR